MGRRQSVRALCSIPIRHHKTITAQHGVAWTLLQDPTFRWIYMTYGESYANTRGREMKNLCRRLGVEIQRGHESLKEWRTTAGGGVYTMSAQSSGLGQDVDGLIVDDPISGPDEADKLAVRQAIDETIGFYTARLSRGGGVAITMSRFHPDDPSGRRLRRIDQEWEHQHSAALIDEGLPTERAFAPLVMTVEELKKKREDARAIDPRERMWWSQFQNDPRAESGELFRAPSRYTRLPNEPGWRDAMGVDFAYSQARRADFFALVIVRIWGSDVYVLKTERLKADFAGLEMAIRRAWDSVGARCPVHTYITGPEKGAVSYFAEHGIHILAMHAKFNKLIRAQKTIDIWNDRRVHVPEGAAWDPFLGRVAAFRGVDGDDDDEIDAMVSAVDGGMWSAVANATRAIGKRRL